MAQHVHLRSVDAAEVTIIVDNSIDLLLPSTDVARRPRPTWDLFERQDQLRAEHGLSLLLTIHTARLYSQQRRHSVLVRRSVLETFRGVAEYRT